MPDWDEVYRSQSVAESKAARVLLENARLLPSQGKALDYACGLGGNALYLAEQGLEVTALDRSEVAVEKINRHASEKGLTIQAQSRDLETNPPEFEAEYDVVVVSYFLHRSTLDKLVSYLKPGGLLCYQTFSGEQINGTGPSNPDFRLKRGELLNTFKHMELLFYREDPRLNTDDSMQGQVLFVAKK